MLLAATIIAMPEVAYGHEPILRMVAAVTTTPGDGTPAPEATSGLGSSTPASEETTEPSGSATPTPSGSMPQSAPSPSPVGSPAEATPQSEARSTLTHDWFGHGPAMRNAGVNLRFEWSQFYQGLISGNDSKQWLYGGHLDGLLRLDLSKLGLWKGLSLTAQGYYNYGESLNGTSGTVFAVNSALFFPDVQTTSGLDLVDLHVTQNIGDLWTLEIGKLNLVEAIRSRPIAGGGGVDTFWNLNPALTSNGITAAALYAAKISLKTKPVSYSLMLYDPVDALNRPLFTNLFQNNGFAMLGTATLRTTVAHRTGFYWLSGGFTTKRGIDFSDIIIPSVPGGEEINMTPSIKKRAWSGSASFQQYILQDPNRPGDGWGIFGSLTRADGNPTIFQWNYLFGICGNSFSSKRPNDRAGVSFSRFGVSDVLKASFSTILDIKDEYALEGFYDFAATGWLRIKADVQRVRPAVGKTSGPWIGGIQTYVKF